MTWQNRLVGRYQPIMANQEQHHVSFVLATHNRRDIAVETVRRLATHDLDRGDYEIIIVDNASTDGTPDAIEPHVDRLIRLEHNVGSCAKTYAVEQATGRYIVFLDDDSIPRPGSIDRMIEHFQGDPELGAAGFTVHLPGGEKEGGALPGVFVGCGVGFRADALRRCGGLDGTFFMQAEEYDLAFRLVSAGWKIDVFDDLHVDHRKTPQARRSERTAYFDTRNNLRVASRYLRGEHLRAYRTDWTQRYGWLAELDGHDQAFRQGLRNGRYGGWLDRVRFRDRRLNGAALERFFGWSCIERSMATLVEAGVRQIVLAGLGKNVYAYYRAAQKSGVTVSAIGHDRFAGRGRVYRGVSIVTIDEALTRPCDAIVIADSSAVHGTELADRISLATDRPVHHWFHGGGSQEPAENRLPPPAPRSDQSSMEPQPAAAG